MRVIVDYESRLESSHRAERKYGDWSEAHSFELRGVRAADDDEDTGYGSEGYLIADGSTHAHVVWIRYSTGDSFGRSDGEGAIIGVFGDRKVAENALNVLRQNSDEYIIEVKDDFGRLIKLHNPGSGYFENIDSFNLDSFSLENASIRIKN